MIRAGEVPPSLGKTGLQPYEMTNLASNTPNYNGSLSLRIDVWIFMILLSLTLE